MALSTLLFVKGLNSTVASHAMRMDSGDVLRGSHVASGARGALGHASPQLYCLIEYLRFFYRRPLAAREKELEAKPTEAFSNVVLIVT